MLFASVLITSCSNEPVGNTGTNNGGVTTTAYYFRVTKDGLVKQWSTVQAINSTTLNSFVISAADSSTSMNLTLFNVSKIGSYNLSWVEVSCIYNEEAAIYSSDYSDFNTSAGNITITELNKTDKTIKRNI